MHMDMTTGPCGCLSSVLDFFLPRIALIFFFAFFSLRSSSLCVPDGRETLTHVNVPEAEEDAFLLRRLDYLFLLRSLPRCRPLTEKEAEHCFRLHSSRFLSNSPSIP